ncbi:MAG: nucleotide sugar dehydrogenase [Acidobacteria bacterium]|nr:nucleotide sugar dehydrogenase [Acidobacteriota bacterium]
MELREKIADRSARIGVIGLGYVGLPLAVEFAKAGFGAIGIDVDRARVGSICAGQSYIMDVPETELRGMVSAGRLSATTDFAALGDVDCVSICVPTPLRKTKDPDIQYVVDATARIRQHLHPGMLIVLESTTYPGTTDEILLSEFSSTGLTVGRDFFLAFSPERVDPGNRRYGTRNTPKIIGGVTPECTRAAKELYEQVVETVIPVSSTKSAEMVKLLENTFRMVNIGLVNEIAIMCDKLGLDVWEIIEAAATKPFGFMPFYPGPGLGGHCIPIDPLYLSWKMKGLNYNARFIELASEVNTNMPAYVATKVARALNRRRRPVCGSRILILGVSYKKDISDIRESPALDIIRLLQDEGAEVMFSDPYNPEIRLERGCLRSIPASAENLRDCDCAVVVTNHSAFDYDLIAREASLVVDCRNALPKGAANVVKL